MLNIVISSIQSCIIKDQSFVLIIIKPDPNPKSADELQWKQIEKFFDEAIDSGISAAITITKGCITSIKARVFPCQKININDIFNNEVLKKTWKKNNLCEIFLLTPLFRWVPEKTFN